MISAPDTPFFSLVVPTLDRTEELKSLLRSLQSQTFKKFEVLVVDQNQDDRLKSILAEFSQTLSISHIFQTEKGASKARNSGMLKAKGSIITFPDDDCEYPVDLLERVTNIFNNHTDLDGITCSSKDPYSGGSITRLSKQNGRISKLNILTRIVEFTIFFKVSKSEMTLFDENFGPGSKTGWWCDEGPDFVLRLMEKGLNFHYYPELVINHPNPAKVFDEKAFKRSYHYGLGRGRFLRKHRYPFWYVLYVWCLYIAGISFGIFQLDSAKIKYYYQGLKGRIKGYLLR